MQLISYPNKILSTVCKITDVKYDGQNREERQRLANKMWKIMRKKRGIGLAAPQVGLNIRMFVWSHFGHSQVIWNPILYYISGEIDSIEGCLSLPGITVTIKRATSSVLIGEGINGLGLKFIGDENTTKVWQHEIDHLDGKMIIDNMAKEDEAANKDILEILKNNSST